MQETDVMHRISKRGTEAEEHLWLVLSAHKEDLYLTSKSSILLHFQHTQIS